VRSSEGVLARQREGAWAHASTLRTPQMHFLISSMAHLTIHPAHAADALPHLLRGAPDRRRT